MKRFLTALCCLLIVLLLMVPSASAEGKKQTVMVYLCGSNLESNGGAASKDVYEMVRSGFDTDKVNVLVMAGGSPFWLTRFPASKTTIFEITNSGPVKVWQQPAMNMGDFKTLATFLQFGYQYYPAEKYALILWDHGGGPVDGFCMDTLAMDSLSLQEFGEALRCSPASEEKLEWIGFDACLMSCLEVANLAAPFANYLIASQAVEPSSGWDYSFLKGLEADSSGAATGKRIVDAYWNSLAESTGEITMACINLKKMDDVNSTLDALYWNLASDLAADTFSDFSTYRNDSRGFGRSATPEKDYDLVDLLDLSQHYSTLELWGVRRLRSAVQNAVIYQRSNLEGASGLSIYHPYYNASRYADVQQQIYDTGCLPFGYQKYLHNFYTQLSGDENAADWTALTTGTAVSAYTNSQWFTVRLDKEQRESVLSARFLILGKLPEGESWCQVYSSGDLSASGSGLITSRYYGQALYAVDDETGAVRAGPLTSFRTLDDGHLIVYAIPADDTHFYADRPLELQFRPTDDGGLELTNIQAYDEVLDQYTARGTSDFQEWASLIIPNLTYSPAAASSGRYLGFSSWIPTAAAKDGWRISNSGWHLQFRTVPISDMELYGTFQITDIQRNAVLTDFVPVKNSIFSH